MAVNGIGSRIRDDASPGQAETVAASDKGMTAGSAGSQGARRATPAAGRRPGARRPRVRLLIRIASVVVGLAIWQVIGAFKLVDQLFLPGLSTTLSQLWKELSSGALNKDFLATGEPFLIGLVISVVGGSLIGVLMGLTRVLEDILTPWILGFNAIPRIAFIPMTVIAFGLGIKAHAAVVVATGIFPMIINMHQGVRSVDPELLEMGTSFRASRWLTIRRVVMPSTAPFFVSGFRMTIALALVGEVVAEFFSANSGIGYRLNVASQVYDIVEVYSMMIILAVVGIVLASLIRLIERRVERWYGTSR